MAATDEATSSERGLRNQYSALRSKLLISAPTPDESPYNLKHISSGVSIRTFVARDDTQHFGVAGNALHPPSSRI